MVINNPKELFVQMLSDVFQGTERTAKVLQEISEVALFPKIKEALEARIFVSEKILAMLDRCFTLIGEKPVKFTGHLQDVFVEDFHRELAEIQDPLARQLFVLARINQLDHFRIAEYVTLIEIADLTGEYAIGLLLESCLADKLTFVERTRRLVRSMIDGKLAEKAAA